MNHSLLSADRTTHLKIASVALLGVLGVVAVGIATRLTAPGMAVIKAGAPVMSTRSKTPPSAHPQPIERSLAHGGWLANPGGVV